MHEAMSTMQKRGAQIGATLLSFAALLFVFVGAAAAKGPESVTINGPGIEQPLELTDHDNWEPLRLLMEQTGLWYAFGDLPTPIEKPTGDLGPAYTLTWINSGPPHKSVQERTMVQRLYLHAESGPIIHTPAQEGLKDWGQGVIGWFAAPDGFVDTLVELGAPVASQGPPVAPALPASITTRALPYVALVGVVLAVAVAGVVSARRKHSRVVHS